jgi:excisionase family DNA binding protein
MPVRLETAEETADRLQVTAGTVRKLVHARIIPAIKIGTGPRPRMRFDPVEVDAALARTAADLIVRTTAESGVPQKLEDPATLSRVASLLEDGPK